MGLGIAQTLLFVAKSHLEAGRLVRPLPELETFAPLYSPTRHMPARIRAFIAFVADLVGKVRDDD